LVSRDAGHRLIARRSAGHAQGVAKVSGVRLRRLRSSALAAVRYRSGFDSAANESIEPNRDDEIGDLCFGPVLLGQTRGGELVSVSKRRTKLLMNEASRSTQMRERLATWSPSTKEATP
jgi:hypothetical protein